MTEEYLTPSDLEGTSGLMDEDVQELDPRGIERDIVEGKWVTGFRTGSGKGEWVRWFPVAGLRRDSVVVASITEITQSGAPFHGNATMTVRNVVPHDPPFGGQDGELRVCAHINFGSNLHFRISFIARNP